MKKEIKVYRRENWQVFLSLAFSLALLFNLVYLLMVYGNTNIPGIWALPFICLILVFLVCVYWFIVSLEKKQYTMVIEDINSKEQKITYQRIN